MDDLSIGELTAAISELATFASAQLKTNAEMLQELKRIGDTMSGTLELRFVALQERLDHVEQKLEALLHTTPSP